jgi:uncharacterized protein (UPF0248 family)
MIPIHELLSRIRWDPAFGEASFALAYHDRALGRSLVVPMREVRIAEGRPRRFEFVDGEGEVHRVPLHRVRQVYRDGELIWQRAG